MNDKKSDLDEDPFASGLSAVRYENVFGRRPPVPAPDGNSTQPGDPELGASVAEANVRADAPVPPSERVPATPVNEGGLPTRADGKVYCCAGLGWVTPDEAFDHRWDTSRPREEWEERAGAWDGIEPGV